MESLSASLKDAFLLVHLDKSDSGVLGVESVLEPHVGPDELAGEGESLDQTEAVYNLHKWFFDVEVPSGAPVLVSLPWLTVKTGVFALHTHTWRKVDPDFI